MTEQKAKVPSQFFQWFDSLKQGYESSINKLFSRVEAVNEEHNKQLKTAYHEQIDDLKKSYQDHLHSLKDNHQSQTMQTDQRIAQLEKDAKFYQQQIQRQNQTIDKLNDRYDTVIFALKDKMDHHELENVVKDISPSENNQPSLNHDEQQQSEINAQSQNEQPNETLAEVEEAEEHSTNEPEKQKIVDILKQAFKARQAEDFELAYSLFYTAANQGDEKAMGAIGRAYFVGEGVAADKPTGLAWLILAAQYQFEPAVKKLQSAQQKSPELYQKALLISQDLLPNQIS
jgi:hypothetical protein